MTNMMLTIDTTVYIYSSDTWIRANIPFFVIFISSALRDLGLFFVELFIGCRGLSKATIGGSPHVRLELYFARQYHPHRTMTADAEHTPIQTTHGLARHSLFFLLVYSSTKQL